MSVQNRAESSVAVCGKVEHPMPVEDARRFIHNILDFEGRQVVGYGGEASLRAHEIRERLGVHFWDALPAATMIGSGITEIITEDAFLRQISGSMVPYPYRGE